MSMDYYIYLKDTKQFSIQSFEQYCHTLGLSIAVYPSFNFAENFGFLPMRLIDTRFATGGESNAYLSGFEMYSSEYRHTIPEPKKPSGFFRKLFKPQPVEESPFDKAVEDASTLVSMRCSSADSFEILLAYVFGAYLVKHCDGVFDDPQTGQFYNVSKHIEIEIETIISELQSAAAAGELLTHEFKEWL